MSFLLKPPADGSSRFGEGHSLQFPGNMATAGARIEGEMANVSRGHRFSFGSDVRRIVHSWGKKGTETKH
jgi:hypothetical protein